MLFWIIVVWILSGILSAGMTFAFHQKAFPRLAKQSYKKDLIRSYKQGLMLGPIGLYSLLESAQGRNNLMDYGVKFW